MYNKGHFTNNVLFYQFYNSNTYKPKRKFLKVLCIVSHLKMLLIVFWGTQYTWNPPILETLLNFTKRTGHSKMRYSLIFSLSEHNKDTKLHSQYRKNWRKSIFKCTVRFVKKRVCPILEDSLYIVYVRVVYSIF